MSAMTQDISVNGETQPCAARTVYELLDARGIDPQRPGIAVAVNGALVPRAAWPTTGLQAGDRVEIVHALAGG
jgi:sulfur carrier protein